MHLFIYLFPNISLRIVCYESKRKERIIKKGTPHCAHRGLIAGGNPDRG